jgi:hypothetical protein
MQSLGKNFHLDAFEYHLSNAVLRKKGLQLYTLGSFYCQLAINIKDGNQREKSH